MPPKRKPTEKAEIAEEIEDTGDLVFEDPFGDDFEDEEFIDDESDDEEGNLGPEAEDMDDDQVGLEEDEENNPQPNQIWRPGVDELPEGEELEFDPSAYVMYHTLRTEWPCLSFDVMRDSMGDARSRFPLSMFIMCGSQAERAGILAPNSQSLSVSVSLISLFVRQKLLNSFKAIRAQ